MKGTAFFGGFCGFILSIREIYTRFNKLYSITVFFVIDTDVTIQSFLIGILYIRMRNFKIIYTCTKSYILFFKQRSKNIREQYYTQSSKKYSNRSSQSLSQTRRVDSYLASIKLKFNYSMIHRLPLLRASELKKRGGRIETCLLRNSPLIIVHLNSKTGGRGPFGR